MNRTVLILVLLVSVAFTATSQIKSPVKQHGQLKVANGKLLDAHGQPPQLRGISLSWSLWGGKKYYNPAVVNWLADDFNITLLRVSMGIEPDGGYLQDPEGQTQLVTTVTDAAIKKGIYVLIDWHDHHAHINVEKSKAFFAKMANKYKGMPNVIYEIYNEPMRMEWPVIKTYAEQVIAEIRKYDAKNIIVVGSSAWDQDVDVTAKDPIKGFDNIAYSFHFYASDPNHQEKLMQKADNAIKAALPLFITEWGVGESDGNGVFDREKNAKWLNWMEINQLSWANWNLTDKEETTAILKPGAPEKGNWTREQLTPAGDYIRIKLKELNK